MRVGFILGYLEQSISFFLENVLVLMRWFILVVEYEEFGTDLLPMTREEYSSCRCFSCKIIDQYNYSLALINRKSETITTIICIVPIIFRKTFITIILTAIYKSKLLFKE